MRTLHLLTIMLALLGLAGCNQGSSDTKTDAGKPAPAKQADAPAEAPAQLKPAEEAKPAPQPEAVPAPAPADAMAGLAITEGRSGIEDGTLVIRGEVKNTTGKWIAGRVLVNLLDANGTPLDVDSIAKGVAKDLGTAQQEGVAVERDVIPPGESSPFEYIRDIAKLGGAYGRHQLVADGRAVDPVGRAEVVGLASKYELGTFEVTGELVGRGDVACEDPAVSVVLYDATGGVFEVEVQVLQDAEQNFLEVLGKDQKAPFKLTIRGEESGTLAAFSHCETPD